jgi:UDP-4-amino-4,6-dideoxy-N-acetyl-beta-L-altrosamine N-acetyltransferase
VSAKLRRTWGDELSIDPVASTRKMTDQDLERVLFWRNQPKVRRFMFTTHEISPEEHIRWYQQAAQDPRRHLLIFELDSTPMGFIHLNEITQGGIADWGFYTAPEAPKGTGRALGNATLHFAFEKLSFHKLCAKVIAFNERSIKFHIQLGFSLEGVLRQQHFDGALYHDVWCFGLCAPEWRSQ